MKVKWVQARFAQHAAAHADADSHPVLERSLPPAFPDWVLVPLIHAMLGGGALA